MLATIVSWIFKSMLDKVFKMISICLPFCRFTASSLDIDNIVIICEAGSCLYIQFYH